MSEDYPQKILIRCPNWVGDLVMATPAIKAIRRRFNRSQVVLLLKPYGKKVIEHFPYFDEILEYDDRDKDQGMRGIFSWAMRLRRKNFDLAVIFPNSFSSALIAFLAGIKRRVGYSREGRGWMLTDPIKPVRKGPKIIPIPMVEYYLRITDWLECPRLSLTPELFVSSATRLKAQDILKRCGVNGKHMTIVMIPGAAYGSSKCWKPEYFAQVADHLIEGYGCNLVIVPGPEEIQIARDIEARMVKRPIVLAAPIVPLDILMAIIQFSSLVITNDTGPRHFAVAFDKPVVVIMGPTDPRYTNLNLEKTTVLREDLDCSPCHLKVCPRDHRCMTAITPEKVIQASERLFNQFVKPRARD
jgi:heptosyltransferase-2